jgi:hypothetical protein
MAACVFLRSAHLYADHQLGRDARRRSVLSFRECVHALRAYENVVNIIRGPVHSVSLRPHDNYVDKAIENPGTVLHVRPANKSSNFGDLSAILAKAGTAELRLHRFSEDGVECALVAARSPAAAAAICRLLNEQRTKRYHVAPYSRWRHDPLWSQLVVISGALLFVCARVACWSRSGVF